MIMICDLKTAKATIVQSTVNKLHVATPGEQLNTTVHISFLLQLTVLMSSVGRINGRFFMRPANCLCALHSQ